jgi:hypothetical protein
MLRLSQFPFKTSVVATLLCYVIIEKPPGGPLHVGFASSGKDLKTYRTEFYPFSGFPMYGEFADNPIITFYTDEKDEPIAIREFTSAGATALKKDYYGLLQEGVSDLKAKNPKKYPGLKTADAPLEVKQAAGRTAFRDFLTVRCKTWSAAHPDKVIRLYEGVLRTPPEGGPKALVKTLLAEGSYQSVSSPTPP